RWSGAECRVVYTPTAGRAYMTNYTLRELEERLDPAVFFRAHKSSLVNLEHVREIVPSPGGRHTLLLRDPGASEVALSRAQARRLRARLRWGWRTLTARNSALRPGSGPPVPMIP